jgi:type I restriction enzyme S subunit
MGMTSAIDLTPDQRAQVQSLLARHLPDTTVWAFGSRVSFKARPDSDLDLVAFTRPDQKPAVAALREAFEESDLPFRVDLLEWDDLPENFKKNIEGGEVSPLAPASSRVPPERTAVASATPHEGLPEGWKVDQLINCTTDNQISYGIVQPGAHDPDGVPILRINNIENGFLNIKDVLKVSPRIDDAYSRTRLSGGEVLLTVVGSTGQSLIVPPTLAGWNIPRAIALIRPKKEIGPIWINICLQLPQAKQHLDTHANTTVQKTLNLKDVRTIPIVLPPKNERDKIAAIHSSLDDKIEVNRAMNETLEQIAQALFKSWFVDFDPVRTKAAGRKPDGMDDATAALFPDSFEDSELGSIPKGWEVKKLGDIGNIICGKTPSKEISKYYGRDVPFLKIPDMHNRVWAIETTDGLSNAGADSQKNKYVPIGSICVSCIATVGLVNIAGAVLQTNQQINSIVPNDLIYSEYLFFYFLHASKLLHDLASAGSATLNLNTSVFSNINVLVPNPSVVKSFHCTVASLFKLIMNNDYQTIELTKIRDSLLPKLLSGEIRVDAQAGSV